jgi:hypothetical protein
VIRLTSFLKRRPGLSRAAFVRRWQDEFGPRLMASAALARQPYRYVLNLPLDPVPPDYVWVAADAFDGVAELWFETLDDAIRVSNALAEDAAVADGADAFLDVPNCVSWLGRVTPDFDKPGVRIKRIVAGQPAPHLTLEEAQKYWLVKHNEFMKSFPDFMAYMLHYTQITGLPTPALKLRSYHLMGMCADVGFASLKDLNDAYLEPAQAAASPADLAKFGASSGAILFTGCQTVTLVDRLPRGAPG